MITLFAFGPAFGLPDSSPFVMKAETLLKMAGLEYRTDRSGFGGAPKGKLPYMNDAGELIADSTFIRWHIEKKYGIDFDRRLTVAERGVAWSVEKLLEDNLYWAMVHARWMDPVNFAKGPATFFNELPWPIRPIVRVVVRRKIRGYLGGQGFGRHTTIEIERLAARGIESVAAVLGDKPYLMGDEPCGADATVFAFVANMLCPVFESGVRTAAESHANLVAFHGRMLRQHFPAFVQG